MKNVTLYVENIIDNSFASSSREGEKLYKRIKKCFDKREAVTLSFSGIEFTTIAFFNASIGRLVGEYSSKYTYEHLNIQEINMSGFINLMKFLQIAREYYSDDGRKALQESVDNLTL